MPKSGATIPERLSSSFNNLIDPKPSRWRGNIRKKSVYDSETGQDVQIPVLTSKAKRIGLGILFVIGVGVLQNPREGARDISSLASNGLATVTFGVIQVGGGATQGIGEGVCEGAETFCDEVGSRVGGVGNAVSGREPSSGPAGDSNVTIEEEPLAPTTTLAAEPPTTTAAPVESTTSTTTTTTAAPATTEQPAPTTVPEASNALDLGAIVCAGAPQDIVLDSFASPSHAITSLSPGLENAGWVAKNTLVEYVYALPENAGLPAPEESTRQTTFKNVPTDCSEK